MKAFPHEYEVTASAGVAGEVSLSSTGLEVLRSAPPAEFDGPGDRWSPETLLVASIADCFILTFRAIARFKGLEWQDLQCSVVGTLERAEGGPRFTRYLVKARLVVPETVDPALARNLLEKAEHGCLVSNSLNGEITLELDVVANAGTP